MNSIAKPDLTESVIALVADTFDVPAGGLHAGTEPGDIAGWDSLGHSVLLTRLARRFRVAITEDLAMPVGTIADLTHQIRQAAARTANA
jgi:acyl carrier protein